MGRWGAERLAAEPWLIWDRSGVAVSPVGQRGDGGIVRPACDPICAEDTNTPAQGKKAPLAPFGNAIVRQ